MTNLEKVKDWILEHPEWEFGPKNDLEKDKLKNGDHFFLWNVYLTNKEKRTTLIKRMFSETNKCRLCWRFPTYSDSMCIHYDFPLNHCHNEILKWLLMDENQQIPDTWKEKIDQEVDEDVKYRKSINRITEEKKNE